MAMFYRTDLSSYAEAGYPKIVTVRSPDELNEYYENNKDVYQFHHGFGGDTDMADDVFSNKTRYGAEFFGNNFLLFVILEEGSGSVRHRVEPVSPENGPLSVRITRIVPEIGTSDMAQWHVMLALDRSFLDMDVAVVIDDEYLADQ